MTRPTFPTFGGDILSTDPQSLASAIRRLVHVMGITQQGKLNCTGEITLTAGATTTTLTDARLSTFSVLVFDATTANAAVELAAGTLYALSSNRGAGTWTLTHANAATTDRTFRYAIIG